MPRNDVEIEPNWEDFMMDKAMGGEEAAVVPIRRQKRKKPAAAEPEAVPATLAELLQQAVRTAIARRGRVEREAAVREETLLEVLREAMRR